MADNVAITAGSGTTIATDDAGAGGHVQIIKLAVSTDGSATVIPATTDGLATVHRPETTGGLTTFKSTDDLDETEEEVKSTAGQVYGYTFHNVATSFRYLKWYNATAASVTVGSTATLWKIGLPPSSAGHVFIPHGIAHSTAITVACTTGVADSDTAAPTANDVAVTVFYK
jgi:hypothetical protein